MFRLLTALAQPAALNIRLFPKTHTRPSTYSGSKTVTVTERCIPVRRRRARQKAAQGTNEQIRSTWF